MTNSNIIASIEQYLKATLSKFEQELLDKVNASLHRKEENEKVEEIKVALERKEKDIDDRQRCRKLKLESYGVGGCVLGWIRSFLTSHLQKVAVGGALSSWVEVLSGVPQSSVLCIRTSLVCLLH